MLSVCNLDTHGVERSGNVLLGAAIRMDYLVTILDMEEDNVDEVFGWASSTLIIYTEDEAF